jgi:hypothetical protein
MCFVLQLQVGRPGLPKARGDQRKEPGCHARCPVLSVAAFSNAAVFDCTAIQMSRREQRDVMGGAGSWSSLVSQMMDDQESRIQRFRSIRECVVE